MADRVTGAEVKAIINTSLTSTDVAPMITAANILVTARCSGAGYSDAELKEIERWLSAHFVSIRDPGSGALASKTIGEAGETYSTTKSGGTFSLESSPYGQQALILDYLGCLTSVGRQKVVLRGFGASNEEFDDEL